MRQLLFVSCVVKFEENWLVAKTNALCEFMKIPSTEELAAKRHCRVPTPVTALLIMLHCDLDVSVTGDSEKYTL